MADEVDGRTGGRGDFFAIDRNVWTKVCGLGTTASIAYLVLARGTLRDNRTTAWSTNAIENYTGISRPRAKKAIEDLISSGLLRCIRGGSKPLYYLVPMDEIGHPKNSQPPLTDDERIVLERISGHPTGISVPKARRKSDGWDVTNPYAIAVRLMNNKIITRHPIHSQVFIPKSTQDKCEPEWIWLPNTIIDGASTREVPPVELIRQTHNPDALPLYVTLYHVQSLLNSSGVHWCDYKIEYDRAEIGEYGGYTIWAFRNTHDEVIDRQNKWLHNYLYGHRAKDGREAFEISEDQSEALWQAFDRLKKLKLIFFVPHVVDSESSEGEIIFPCDIYSEIAAERKVARAADAAARTLLEVIGSRVDARGCTLVPLPSHITNAQVVGLLRLRHRARTNATAQWLEKSADWEVAARRLNDMAEKAKLSQSHATSRVYQMGIK